MVDIRFCTDDNFDQDVELIKKYKIGIEFQTFYDPFIKNLSKTVKYQKEQASKIKHKSIHAPFWELNPGTKMPGLRKETMKMYNFAYKTAKELGCDSIIVHNGYYPGTYGYTGWVKRTTAFWQEFFSDKDNSITVMIENQFEKDSELMKMVIDSVNDKRLKINLDIGHANCNSNMSVYNWIKTLGNRIGYLHLHNNHGKDSCVQNLDEHLDITNGTIDIKKVVKLVKKYCPKAVLSIESSKNAEKSIELLKKLTK